MRIAWVGLARGGVLKPGDSLVAHVGKKVQTLQHLSNVALEEIGLPRAGDRAPNI